MTYLDDALPVWHWCETYGRRVDAPPQDALAAFFAVTLNDMPLTRLLMTLRDLPSACSVGVDTRASPEKGLPSTGCSTPAFATWERTRAGNSR